MSEGGKRRVLLAQAPNQPHQEPTRRELEKAGVELVCIPYKTTEELLQAAADVDALYQGPVAFTREVLEQLPRLRAICAMGIGYDNMDIQAATDLGIVAINLPRVFHREVAAHAMALLLALIRQIVPLNAAMRERATNPAASGRAARPTHHIYGETLGLIAFGNIARVVARMARAFELRVIAFDPFVSPETAREHEVTLVSLEELLRESDFVSMHTPLSDQTYHLMGEAQFRMMKPTALFVNTSRGRVVDEKALIRALQEGWIGGAGLDVTEKEPTDPDNPLLRMDHVIMTPHVASASDRALEERYRWLGIEVGRVLNGQWPLEGLINKKVKPRFPLA